MQKMELEHQVKKLQVVIEQLNEKIKNNPDKKINDLFDAYAPGVYRNDNK